MTKVDFLLQDFGFFTPEECESYIEYFEEMSCSGMILNRIDNDNRLPDDVSDDHFFYHAPQVIRMSGAGYLVKNFMDKFWTRVYPEYTKKYSILSKGPRHGIYSLKCQRIKVGDGYHSWHYENAGRNYNYADRLLTFIVYLNDVEEGGETEFLYYPARIKPKQGSLVLFPGHFTHTHRGNQPLSNTKYILTGWMEYE